VAWARGQTAWIDEHLSRHGALLFRGGGFDREETFAEMARVLCGDLFADYGDLPRTTVGGGVYGSTPYPNDRAILFHNESSHLTTWPRRITFACVEPSSAGGETPLADGRTVLAALDPAVRQRFAERGLCYVRNFIPGLDVHWQDFFRTDSPAEVEERCRAAGMELEWTAGDGLRIRQRRPAIVDHPATGAPVWFNQIALHHVGYLEPAVRDSLVQNFTEEGLPRHVVYGDGSAISTDDLAAVDAAYEQARAQFTWQRGDVLLVDNMMAAHGRNPFTGQRRIIVAMGGMQSATPHNDQPTSDT
ncbi:MAG: TauD/TfdA family dioxygenase, partial [Myxococcota bacterium]